MKESILIISYSLIDRDPRVLRQIQVLRPTFNVVVAGLSNPNLDGVHFIQAFGKKPNKFFQTLYEAGLSFLRLDFTLYWNSDHLDNILNSVNSYFKFNKPKLILCNDIGYFPLAVKLKHDWKCKLMVDFHEYSPTELEDKLLWRLRFKSYYTRILRNSLPHADIITTVCNGIKQKFLKEFNVNSDIILNAPFFQNLKPSEIDPTKIKIVHHGAAIRSRYLELMIDLMDYLDSRFELNLILIDTDLGYLDELKSRAKGKKIFFLPSVPTNKISSFINQFDIGLFILPPVNFNYKIALPNKFFEFVQANLCIAIGPSEEMELLVNKYDLGIVAPDFTPITIATKLNSLTLNEIIKYKNNTNKHAYELSFESSSSKLLNHVNSLLNEKTTS